jgi:ferritin-like metal-binding protein YciE
MQDFERAYMRTLRHIYDTERQLIVSARSIAASTSEPRLAAALRDIEAQSAQQVKRIEGIFAVLYLEPRGEASWVATALLREAWESCAGAKIDGTQGCAAALLAIKRYEITLYEALLRWSEHQQLIEAIPDIRRCVAEELVQASILSELAFEGGAANRVALAPADHTALH